MADYYFIRSDTPGDSNNTLSGNLIFIGTDANSDGDRQDWIDRITQLWAWYGLGTPTFEDYTPPPAPNQGSAGRARPSPGTYYGSASSLVSPGVY